MHLEHINLTVSDLQRSAAFYRDLFGYRTRWEGTTNDGRPAAHIGDDHNYIALFQARETGSVWQRDYGVVGVNHAGFVVDDLDALRERLVALNVTPGEIQDYDPGRRLYFFDPDGIEIELVQYEEAAV